MKRLPVFELHSGNLHLARKYADISKIPLYAAKPLGTNRNAPGLQGVHKQFVVEERLASASSFEIYECTDPMTDERVLIKVLVEGTTREAERIFEIELTQLIEHGADWGLCLSSRGRSKHGPYYAINGNHEAALKFMLSG